MNKQCYENEQKRARYFSSQILRPLLLVMLVLLIMLVFFIIRVSHNSSFYSPKWVPRIIRNGPVAHSQTTVFVPQLHRTKSANHVHHPRQENMSACLCSTGQHNSPTPNYRTEKVTVTQYVRNFFPIQFYFWTWRPHPNPRQTNFFHTHK